MSQEEKTLSELFRELAASDTSGRDPTLLLNAVQDFERERLTTLRIGPAVDTIELRFVRFRIFGVLRGVPAKSSCFVGDIPSEEGESLAVMNQTIASLPAGKPAESETIREALDSDIATIVAVVIFKNRFDEWVRFIFHHPRLSMDEALGAARELIFEMEIFGPN